jgi:hypothetical protein
LHILARGRTFGENRSQAEGRRFESGFPLQSTGRKLLGFLRGVPGLNSFTRGHPWHRSPSRRTHRHRPHRSDLPGPGQPVSASAVTRLERRFELPPRPCRAQRRSPYGRAHRPGDDGLVSGEELLLVSHQDLRRVLAVLLLERAEGRPPTRGSLLQGFALRDEVGRRCPASCLGTGNRSYGNWLP